jgi:hypothetical protein
MEIIKTNNKHARSTEHRALTENNEKTNDFNFNGINMWDSTGAV